MLVQFEFVHGILRWVCRNSNGRRRRGRCRGAPAGRPRMSGPCGSSVGGFGTLTGGPGLVPGDGGGAVLVFPPPGMVLPLVMRGRPVMSAPGPQLFRLSGDGLRAPDGIARGPPLRRGRFALADLLA
jgi:hypothetical protein